MTQLAAVLLAGGSGSRVGASTNKVLLPLAGVPVLLWSVRTILRLADLRRLVVVVREADRGAVEQALAPELGEVEAWLVTGGETRHDSETRALESLRADIVGGAVDVVAIHDAARPLADLALWEDVVARATAYGGALPVVPTSGLVLETPTTGSVVAVQTPQAFRATPLLTAYDAAGRDGFRGTDTAACLAAYGPGLVVSAAAGSPTNLKITWPGDVAVAEALLSAGSSTPPAP